ncbi:tripartite tricarboxylate transporter permease [Candidatus Woesearchaeota archaeon]|nr:tripartite tricarboxylate transporter permease [Candidatus Woesearchaeota archaeon]
MFGEIFLALLLGVLAGCFTGLIPGIHVNLIAMVLLSASVYLLNFVNEFTLGVFIIAMAITHTFLDTIPSIFLGAPDSDSVLAVLPGHKMLLRGEGYKAVKLTVIGSLFGLFLAVILIPILIPVVVFIYSHIEKLIGWLLVLVVSFMLWKEKKKIFWGLWQFLLAGVLGLIVLNLPSLKHPLLAMLSGLFGISTLVISLNSKVKVPKQKLTGKIKMSKSRWARAIGISIFSGGSVALLPGLGSAAAGVMGNELTGNLGDQGFLVLIGGISTVNMAVSLLTFYALSKARNGAIVVVKDIISAIDFWQLIGFLGVCLVAGSIAAVLALVLSRKFASLITKINYRILALAIIGFVSFLVFLFSGFLGFFVMAVSMFIGMIPSFTGVKKSLNMGCLMLPVMIWFLV